MLDYAYEVVSFELVEGRLHREDPVRLASGGEAMCMAARLAAIKSGVMVRKTGDTMPVATFGSVDPNGWSDLPRRPLSPAIVCG